MAAVLTSFVLVGCIKQSKTENQQTVDAFDRIVVSETLNVGYIPFPPAVHVDPNSQYIGGHFAETIRLIAAEAGWKVEFIETDWANFGLGLESDRFDVSIAPTFVTIPRARVANFTAPLFYAGNSAVVGKDDNRFTTIESLDREDVIIAVTQGEAGAEFVSRNFSKAKVRTLPGPNQALTFQEVLTGRADVAMGDEFAVGQFVSQNAGAADLFAGRPYDLTPVSWAVSYDSPKLLNFLNASLTTLEARGELARLEKESGANWVHQSQVFLRRFSDD